MLDMLSFDPVADAAAVATLLLAWWQGNKKKWSGTLLLCAGQGPA
jgi:phosphatidylglycerophosphate synthase